MRFFRILYKKKNYIEPFNSVLRQLRNMKIIERKILKVLHKIKGITEKTRIKLQFSTQRDSCVDDHLLKIV